MPEKIFRHHPTWKLQHTFRECNRVADKLAKLALDDIVVWMEDGPRKLSICCVFRRNYVIIDCVKEKLHLIFKKISHIHSNIKDTLE